MAASAPVAPMVMDRAALNARFGEMEADEGVHDFVTTKDGWKLHRETWSPSEGPAKAVFLFLHGNGESTLTIGVRRLAAALTKRGIILETYDAAGHGQSLEKNGKLAMPAAFRGQTVEPASQKGDHLVEIAELVIKKHQLPLFFSGHSGAGMGACLATDRIIALCEANGVPFAGALYLSPGLGVMKANAPCGLTCCHGCIQCCWVGCCCNCCGKPCIKVGDDHYNPKNAIGADNSVNT